MQPASSKASARKGNSLHFFSPPIFLQMLRARRIMALSFRFNISGKNEGYSFIISTPVVVWIVKVPIVICNPSHFPSLRGAESGISAAADNSRDLTQATKQSHRHSCWIAASSRLRSPLLAMTKREHGKCEGLRWFYYVLK